MTGTRKWKWMKAGWLGAGLMLLAGFACAAMSSEQGRKGPPSPVDLEWLRREAGDGALVHHADGRLYLTELSTGQSVYIGPGEQPEFSPDSSKLAWIEGGQAKGRMRKGETRVHVIARQVEGEGGVHWLDDESVALVLSVGGRKAWHRVTLGGQREEIADLNRLGTGGYECDVRRGEDGVWSYVADQSWATSDGRRGRLPGTCSVSLSPDGRSATSLHNPHYEAPITAVRPGGVERVLRWNYRGSFDNHRWSSNDSRFIAAVDEHFQTMVVMLADGSRLTRMGTFGRAKHGMYADFTVGDGEGAPWPQPGGESAAAWPGRPQGLAFVWRDGQASNSVEQPGAPPRLCRLERQGRARYGRHYVLRLGGGQAVTDALTSHQTGAEVAGSGRFTFQGLFHPPPDGKAGGPDGTLASWRGAAGFALSSDAQQLRLRFASDGGEWSFDLGPLPETPFHLALGYAPGRLQVRVGGRQRLFSRQPVGTLSGWKGGGLQVGPWAGGVEGLAIHARQAGTSELESARLDYLTRIWQRRPLPLLRVEAQLTAKTDLPPAGAYPQTLVVYDYRLLGTLQGEHPQGPLRVVHWGILNGQVQPVAQRKVGAAFRLRLEPFQEHPQLQGLRKVDDGASSAPLFVEVEDEERQSASPPGQEACLHPLPLAGVGRLADAGAGAGKEEASAEKHFKVEAHFLQPRHFVTASS